MLDPRDFDELSTRYNALTPDAQAWFKDIVKQSNQAGVDFGAVTAKTARRWWLYRGLIALAADGGYCDEWVRAAVAHVLGQDGPLFPVITVGHAVGVLSAYEAQKFSHACNRIVGRLLTPTVTPGDELIRLVA